MADKKDVIVVTMTRAKDKKTADRILTTLGRLRKEGYDVIAADGGSLPEMVEKAKGLGVDIFRRKSTEAGDAMLEAMEHGYDSGRKIVVYMESDKTGLPSELAKAIKPVQEGKAVLCIPARDRETFGQLNFPQGFSERYVDNVFQAISIGKWTDALFGTRVMKREVVPLFLEYKTKGHGWGAGYYGVTRIGRRKLPIATVKVNAPYPPQKTLQRGKLTEWLKDARYRERQVRDVVHGIREGIKQDRLERALASSKTPAQFNKRISNFVYDSVKKRKR